MFVNKHSDTFEYVSTQLICVIFICELSAGIVILNHMLLNKSPILVGLN